MSQILHVLVGGVRAATATRAELAQMILQDCLARRANGNREPPRLMFDINGHGISLAAMDADYRQALDLADIVHADGGWIVTASRLVSGRPIPERSATTDLLHDLAIAGIADGLRHYLLGATEEVNAKCAALLEEIHPGIIIAGRHHGFFKPDEEINLIESINATEPDLLWIGLGKPREQMFAVRHRDRLQAGWAISCGGCFNYVTGDYRRAPRWMQRANLEWLFRAMTTPKLFWRYATTSPHAIWLALTRVDRRVLKSD